MQTIKWRRLALRTTFIAFCVAGLLRLVDDSNIYSTATPAADIASDRTVEIIVHGRRLFISKTQQERLSYGHWSSLLIYALLIACFLQKWRMQSRKEASG